MTLVTTEHDVIRQAAERSCEFLLARELGVSSSAMARMDNEGVLQRVVPGVYIGAGQAQETLIEPAAWAVRHPHAVACLLTAAVYHDLTDAFARGTWLYVPKGTTQPRSRVAALHVVQTAPRYLQPEGDADNGIMTVSVHGVRLRITNPDRTTIDLWRYPRRIPREHALDALRRRVRSGNFRAPRFARLARRMSAWNKIEATLQGVML